MNLRKNLKSYNLFVRLKNINLVKLSTTSVSIVIITINEHIAITIVMVFFDNVLFSVYF